jgi:hypothetical protein
MMKKKKKILRKKISEMYETKMRRRLMKMKRNKRK